MRKALLCSVALLTLACAVALAAVPVTSEITVNTGLSGRQVQPSVAMDADGDFAVVWEDRVAAAREIRLRRFTRAGGPTTGEITMDTTAADHQDPAVAMSATGAGVAAWQNATTGQIAARRFDADSAEGAEIPVDASTAAGSPDVAVDADGDFVVVWQDDTAAPAVIRARRFNAAGTPQGAGAFTINEVTASASLDPAVAIDADGNFVVAWERTVAAGNDDVLARVFNANESPRTGDLPIATGTADQDDPESAMDADGDLAVAWESGDDVLAVRYDSDGAATSAAFPVHSATAGTQGNVRIGLDAAGTSLAATWDSNASGSDEVRARRFGAGGVPLSGEVPVNTTVAGTQGDPGLGADASGRFVVAWESPGNPEDIIARRFDPGSTTQPPNDPPEQVPPLPPECQNPTTLLVTCAQLARPAVCGPTGTILPACYFPVRLPTVCGPSFGTILAPCQARGPNTVACGGTGTILPQCNLPAPNIPQVCGPSSGGPLPACTGANAPITVCGPSSGSIVPACNFATKIKAEVFNLNSGKGQLDITLNCPKAGGSGARASQKGKACPKSGTITLADWRAVQKSTLVSAASTMARITAERVDSCIVTNSETCDGSHVPESQRQTTEALANLLGRQNAGHFTTRTGIQTDDYLFEGGPPADFVARDVNDNLLRVTTFTAAEGPSYRRPDLLTQNNPFRSDVFAVTDQLQSAVDEYKLLLKRSKPGGSSATAAAPAAGSAALVRRSKTTVKRFKLRRGRKKRIRIKLTRKDVRKLARYAGRRRVLPIRVIVSFKAKPRPVARVFDIRLPIKPKKAKRKKR